MEKETVMTEKELKHLNRADLLELLLEQSRENDRLRQELTEAQTKLDERTIRVESTGSLADAALALSGVFEAAQDACDLYLDNIRQQYPELDIPASSKPVQRKRCASCPVRRIMKAIAAHKRKIAAAIAAYKKPSAVCGLNDGE